MVGTTEERMGRATQVSMVAQGNLREAPPETDIFEAVGLAYVPLHMRGLLA